MSILLKDSFLSLQNDISRLSVAEADGGGKVARKLLPVEAGLNDVVRATIKTAEPWLFDADKKLPANGTAILIDQTSHITVGACLIQ